jgi:hypothetical protein
MLVSLTVKGRQPDMERFPNVGRCDIFMEAQPPPDKHEKLKIKEDALFLTAGVLISAIGVKGKVVPVLN